MFDAHNIFILTLSVPAVELGELNNWGKQKIVIEVRSFEEKELESQRKVNDFLYFILKSFW